MKESSTLALSLLLLGGLAGGSYWLAEQARQSDAASSLATGEPDSFVERFTLTRLDAKGVGLYTIRAARMTHYPLEEVAKLEAPQLTSLNPDRPRVDMIADSARLTRAAHEIHLHGNVQMRRNDLKGGPELILNTPYLLVLPDQDLARTDQNFELTRGSSRISGRGLEFNERQRLLQFNPANQSGVRIRTVIDNPRAPASQGEAQKNSRRP